MDQEHKNLSSNNDGEITISLENQLAALLAQIGELSLQLTQVKQSQLENDTKTQSTLELNDQEFVNFHNQNQHHEIVHNRIQQMDSPTFNSNHLAEDNYDTKSTNLVQLMKSSNAAFDTVKDESKFARTIIEDEPIDEDSSDEGEPSIFLGD